MDMEYRQPPPMTEEEMETFFQKAKIARFCSINKDGTIHAVPVWFNYSDGKFLIGAPVKSRRVANIKRNSNVTLLVDEEGPRTRAVIIYAKAEIHTENIDDIAIEIFKRYMPAKEAIVYQKGLFKLTSWIGLHVIPMKMTSFDYGKDVAYRAATKDEL